MEIKNCGMCTMPNCISRNLSSKEDCLLDKKLSANDSFDFLEQSLVKFAIDFAYKGKTLKECLDKYKSNIIAAAHTIEPTIHDIVDEHWWEMLGEEPVSEDLEEAAQRYNEDMSWRWEAPKYPHLEAFKAGAKWQKQKDAEALNENALLYNARLEGIEIGKAEMKQQMMKEAVICVVEPRYKKQIGWYLSLDIVMNEQNYKVGDRVKMIIIEED